MTTQYFSIGSTVHLTARAAKEASIDQKAWEVICIMQDPCGPAGTVVYTCVKVAGEQKSRVADFQGEELEQLGGGG